MELCVPIALLFRASAAVVGVEMVVFLGAYPVAPMISVLIMLLLLQGRSRKVAFADDRLAWFNRPEEGNEDDGVPPDTPPPAADPAPIAVDTLLLVPLSAVPADPALPLLPWVCQLLC